MEDTSFLDEQNQADVSQHSTTASKSFAGPKSAKEKRNGKKIGKILRFLLKLSKY